MNEYLKEYIELQKQFRETKGNPDSVRALYTFKEKLELSEDKQAKEEYNWDDGFEVPRTILADPDCDLALALEIFYLAGGYEYLEKSAKRTKLQKWNPFITVLYEDILDNRFPKTDASFEIPLSKVQKYKLRKKGAAEIFLTDL